MSWALAKTTRGSKLAVRLAIEGLGYEFVSDVAMEGTSAEGRERVAGLDLAGITFGEQVDIPSGTLEGEGFTARIVDRQRDSAVTSALAWAPQVVTYLSSDASTTDTTISVLSSAGITGGDVIHIGTEAILVGSISDGDLDGCTRAYWETIAQAHFTGDGDELPAAAVYLDRPSSIEGRRAYLYVYGEGDDLADTAESAGTLLWKGVCLTDAALEPDGSAFTITLASISELLKGDLGGRLGETVRPRGVYYPWTDPLRLKIFELDTDNPGGDRTSNFIATAVSGFWESNDEFCADLTDTIAALIGSWQVDKLIASAVGDEGWIFKFETGATARWIDFTGTGSEKDGYYSLIWAAGGDGAFEVSANADYECRPVSGPVAAGSAPRGWYGRASDMGTIRAFWGDGTDEASRVWPETRIYVDGTNFPAVDDLIDVLWPGGATSRGVVNAIDTTSRYLDVRLSGGPSSGQVYTRDSLPELSFRTMFADGSLADFRDALTTDSPGVANRGDMPFVTAADLADWDAEVTAAARGRTFALSRNYVAYEAVKLDELLAEEMKLLGVFPIIDSDGKIGLSLIRLPSRTELTSADIGADAIAGDDERVTWERNARGSVNTVIIRTGWNAQDRKHTGETYIARDGASYAERKQALEVEVAPISEAKYSDVESPRQAADLARPLLGLFGSDYSLVTIPIFLDNIDVLLGDVVSVTSPHLPNVVTGTRGVTGAPGFVIGRRWDLERGRGELTVIMGNQNIAGYAPEMFISAESNTSGNTWDLTLDTQDPTGVIDWVPTGMTAEDLYAVGDQIRAYKWDDGNPTTRVGEVDSVSGNSMTVTFDASWTPGSAKWVLAFDESAADATANEQLYAWLAGDDAVIDFATSVSAMRFGP